MLMDFTSSGTENLLSSEGAASPKPQIAEKPLARAALRLKRAQTRTLPPQNVPGLSHGCLPAGQVGSRQQKIVEMRAQGGTTVAEIASKLGVSRATVERDLTRPWVQQSIQELREAFKRVVLEQAVKNVVAPAFEMARNKIQAGEAKDFDATMRGINALEKTTQSASGEAQKVDVTQVQVQLNRTELYTRIEHFLGQ